MKSKLIKILIFLFIIALVFMLLFHKSLPVNYTSVSKIEVYDIREKEPKKLITIEQKDQIDAINRIIKKAIGGIKDNPACPFSLSMVFYDGNKEVTIVLGTDDCGLIQYKNRYYSISKKDTKILQVLIEKSTGIEFDKLRL